MADDWLNMPLGADLDPTVSASVVQAMGAAGADLSVASVAGAMQRKIARGIHYENLRDAEADYIREMGAKLVKSVARRITPGGILEPYGQATGICNGCGWSGMAWVTWCARYMLTRTGAAPREVPFLWPYLAARGGLRGDSGAFPAHSAQAFHDLGVLPIDGGGRWDLATMPPHGAGSQETLAVQMRDNPRILDHWKAAAAPFKCRVNRPVTELNIADSLASLYCVGVGSSRQITPTKPGSTGISAFHTLNGGHWTMLSGWFTLNGRVGFIKDESWWNIRFPASGWPENRVTIQTDDGPRKLYEGQGACLASELVSFRPELWACSYPGSRA